MAESDDEKRHSMATTLVGKRKRIHLMEGFPLKKEPSEGDLLERLMRIKDIGGQHRKSAMTKLVLPK